MSYYLEKTDIGYDGRYQIFSPLPVDTSTKEEIKVLFKPIAAINTQQVIEFNIPAASHYYVDLSRTTLRISLKLMKSDGSAIIAGDVAGLINYPLNTLFRNIEFSIQQKEISPDVGTNYPYKCMLDALMYKTSVELKTSMQAAGFYFDTAQHMDSLELSSANMGLLSRHSLTEKGEEAIFEGSLCLDATQITQYLPNGLDFKFKLYPARDAFTIMSETENEYSVGITSASLSMYYLSPTSELILGHNEAIKRGPAVYAFERSVVKSWVIPENMQVWSIDSLFADACPSELVIALTSSVGYTGSTKKNPFNFKHFDLEYLSFNVEGYAANTAVFMPNYTKKQYTHEFLSIFDDHNDSGSGVINYNEYGQAYAIYRIKLSRGVQRDYASMNRKGQTRLSFRFRTSLPETVTVIAYGKFPATLQIDSSRNVYVV